MDKDLFLCFLGFLLLCTHCDVVHDRCTDEDGSVCSDNDTAVESLIYIGLELSLRMETFVLTDTVEDNHVVVDCITDDCKYRGDERLVYVKAERKDSREE